MAHISSFAAIHFDKKRCPDLSNVIAPPFDVLNAEQKATLAAAQYLKDLYALFGDWNLALAGYNAGEGKVLRGMTAAFEVTDGDPVSVAVVILPRPSCDDGVDNNSNGIVDQDDPTCRVDGGTELPPSGP